MGEYRLYLETQTTDGVWRYVDAYYGPKDYHLFFVLGASEVFEDSDIGLEELESEEDIPGDVSADLECELADLDEDEEVVRHVALSDLLAYPWDVSQPCKYVTGALGFHRFETAGDKERLLFPIGESLERARRIGLREISNEEMRQLIRDRPDVLYDKRDRAAGAFTIVEAPRSTAEALSFDEALIWLRQMAEQHDQARVVMVLSV